MNFKLTGGIVLGAIITIICIQNYGTVDLSFLIWQISMPMIIVVITTFLFGFLCGLIYLNHRKKRE